MLLLGGSLAGCSGHPGAGNWTSDGTTTGPFSKLTVHYEGRAELFDAGSGAESHHCFWGAKSADEVQLDCTTPEDTETRIRFVLWVDEAGAGHLLKDDREIGRFKRTPQ
ncbi:hypothetical protein [Sedimenticola thiotaurini]|uniref:Lipoprotein n=1 Tax=Sedimenticola thiotaurini TaxID=1543721 RepID=A0A0F7K017_9GAMM|nr:hypothetical protein [Sedimenticola thiotaurini]AKH20243.1 hypothetical protein AAY24_07660 [Sedimenticola thiotaurini]